MGWRFCTSLRTGRSASVLYALTSGGDHPPRATDSHRQQRAGLRQRLSRANLPARSPHPRPLEGLTHPGPCSPAQLPRGQAPGNLWKRPLPCPRATDTIQVGQPQACSPPCLLLPRETTFPLDHHSPRRCLAPLTAQSQPPLRIGDSNNLPPQWQSPPNNNTACA